MVGSDLDMESEWNVYFATRGKKDRTKIIKKIMKKLKTNRIMTEALAKKVLSRRLSEKSYDK